MFELDAGDGDRHRVLRDTDGSWWGWENLFGTLPGPARQSHIHALARACEAGEAKYGNYEITEMPTPAAG